MAPRPPRRSWTVLAASGQGRGDAAELAANRPRNWLLALTLHSFAKFANDGRLTDLERSIVTASGTTVSADGGDQAAGPDTKTIPSRSGRSSSRTDSRSWPRSGRVHLGGSEDRRAGHREVVPRHAERGGPRRRGHSRWAGLAQGLPARPGDAAGTRERGTDRVEPAACGARAAAGSPSRPRVPLQRSCRDDVFGPSNEAYWIFGSTDGDETKATRSSVFGDVDSGESRNFAATDGILWGLNGAAQALPDGEVGALISLWEHDEGDPKEIQAGVAAAFAAAAAILVADRRRRLGGRGRRRGRRGRPLAPRLPGRRPHRRSDLHDLPPGHREADPKVGGSTTSTSGSPTATPTTPSPSGSPGWPDENPPRLGRPSARAVVTRPIPDTSRNEHVTWPTAPTGRVRTSRDGGTRHPPRNVCRARVRARSARRVPGRRPPQRGPAGARSTGEAGIGKTRFCRQVASRAGRGRHGGRVGPLLDPTAAHRRCGRGSPS